MSTSSVAEMVSADKCASAYGMFMAIASLAWFLGSALMGILSDRLVVFSVVIQLATIPIFPVVSRSRTLN